MMKSLKLVLCLSLAMGSCVADNPDVGLDASTSPLLAGEVWICHNPDTQFHDKLCVDGIYPDGCYIEGDNHAYCWLLRTEDCADDAGAAPWKKHCPEL